MSIRASAWSVAALAGSVLSAGGIVELGTIGQAGETADVPSAVDADTDGRWLRSIVVDPADLEGVEVDVVEPTFHADDLACFDGAVIRPEAVAAGWAVTFERSDDPDDGRAAVDPPVIPAAEVRVDCPDGQSTA